MATEDNLILHLPMDEREGSSVAYDYSHSHANGAVSGGADFEVGQTGNCLNFAGAGKCEVERDLISFRSNFSLLAWLSRNGSSSENHKIGFLVAFDSTEPVYVERWYNVMPDAWMHFALVREGTTYRIYINGAHTESITQVGTPKGISFVDDYYGSEDGNAKVDNVQLYNKALTQEEINAQIVSGDNSIEYYIDGVDIKSNYGIYVSASDGLLDRPKTKAPLVVDWPDYHGEVVDLRKKRVEPREITLKCFCKATGKIDFVAKMNAFYDLFKGDGTQRLEVDIHPTKPLVYEVYLQDGIAVSKRWNGDLMVGTFTLKLREPDPVKRVLMFNAVSGTMQVTITMTSQKYCTIFWGDKTATYNCGGGTGTYTHTYETAGAHYIIIAGVIEDITAFSTNAVVAWQRI